MPPAGACWRRTWARPTLAEPDADGDEARTLQATAITHRIDFGPRTGRNVLTLRGAMARGSTARQPLCADIDGNRAARGGAGRRKRPQAAGTAVPPHHVPGAIRRVGATHRRQAGGVEAQDTVARRQHAPGDVADGVHSAAGRAGAAAEAALADDCFMAVYLSNRVPGLGRLPPMNSGRSGGPKADARGRGRADLRRFVPSEWDQVRATSIEPALPFQPIGARIGPAWRAKNSMP